MKNKNTNFNSLNRSSNKSIGRSVPFPKVSSSRIVDPFFFFFLTLLSSNIRFEEYFCTFLWPIKTLLQANETCLVTPDFFPTYLAEFYRFSSKQNL